MLPPYSNCPLRNARVQHRRHHLPHLRTGPEELEVRPVADACAPIDKRAVLPAALVANFAPPDYPASWFVASTAGRSGHVASRTRPSNRQQPETHRASLLDLNFFPSHVLQVRILTKKAATNRAAFGVPELETGSAGNLFHLLGVHVEVRVDILRVVEVFKRFEQAHHLVRRRAFQLRIRGRDHGDLVHHRSECPQPSPPPARLHTRLGR